MSEGKKFDQGKLPYDLVDWKSIEELTEILQFGATKYAPNNWQKLDDGANRYFAAALRHLFAYRTGERLDPETNKSHLAHAFCNLMFLMWLERKNDAYIS